MPRKNEYGKYIFSAGEIGEYIVCPEAWRLKIVEGVKAEERKNAKLGVELHKQWAEDYDAAIILTREFKIALTLIICAIVCFLLFNM